MLNLLSWGIKLDIISFLTPHEIYLLGCCDKSYFLIFLRDKVARKSLVTTSTRFLGCGWKRESICIASYPRCGNSFLRKLLEDWSGTITGADSHPYRTLSKSLLQCGFAGEGVTDRSVWMIKTHYPERHGYKRYLVDRAILLIRNPFDAIQSYFHMGMTNTHNQTLTEEAFNSLSHIWNSFLLNEIQVYSEFYRWWFQRSLQSHEPSAEHPAIPILLVRYEDLLADRDSCMKTIQDFLLSGKPPIGLTYHPREQKSSAGYVPRVKKSQPGTSLHTIYTNENIQNMVQQCGDVLSIAGYQVLPDEVIGTNSSAMSLRLLPPQFHSIWNGNGSGPIMMNESFCIRRPDDPYGRGITQLRKSLTKDDTEPFPVI